jgi:hypothetical protein
VKDTILALIDELSDVKDVVPPPRKDTGGIDPPPRDLPTAPVPVPPVAEAPADRAGPWRADKPVLCIAGRGALDEASAAMLAQLLGKHGLGAEIADAQEVTRRMANLREPAGFAMICVAYLELNGSPSHLRYLLRRLRARFPGVPLLVGIWPSEDQIRVDQRLRAVTGADFYASSLREAVSLCLDVATAAGDTRASAA